MFAQTFVHTRGFRTTLFTIRTFESRRFIAQKPARNFRVFGIINSRLLYVHREFIQCGISYARKQQGRFGFISQRVLIKYLETVSRRQKFSLFNIYNYIWIFYQIPICIDLQIICIYQQQDKLKLNQTPSIFSEFITEL